MLSQIPMWIFMFSRSITATVTKQNFESRAKFSLNEWESARAWYIMEIRKMSKWFIWRVLALEEGLNHLMVIIG